MSATSVREFMQRALYDPQRGYYTARINTVGARGDFSTSATLSSALGKAIAAWLRSEMKRTGIRTIIEIGAGDGSLMQSVSATLGWWQRRSLRVCIVETSPRLIDQQQARLGACMGEWFHSMSEAMRGCEGQAIIFHNEVMDAFPVDVVQWRDGAWHEVWMDGQSESSRALTLDCEHFAALRSRPTQDQRCELQGAVREWFISWLPEWKRGAMLAIDYGGEYPALYHRRPRGTLRAYLMQQRLEGADVFANPGRQDITCDVNFTDVRAWLTELGTQEMSYESQREFIARHGVKSAGAADGFLADEAGAGSAFRCLAVGRES